jgi:hypothetical protein
MINSQDVPQQKSGILAQEAAGTVVLLDPVGGEYYSLDEIGGRIWALCDGRRSIEQMVAVLCEEYEVSPDTVRADILELFEELAGEGLVTFHA